MTASQEPRPPQRAAVFNSGPVVQAGEKFEMRGRYVAGRDMTVIHEARPAPQALFQLPPDIREFTDRETELTELGRLIEPAGEAGTAVVVSALMGKPGVGKSALVIHLAHRLAPRFPDAQLYVDLRGPEQERREPAEVLAEFLRALGVDGEAVPATLAERAGLYRGLLAGRRALVVLDNARDERQLRPLLPGSPGCAVLITSRAPLGGLEGARLQPLDVIDRPAAVELLGKIAGPERVGAEPQAAAAIADLCGDLPLAVRIAGGLLAERSSWNVARLAARLGDERRRLSELQVGDREVRGSFALGYHELSADEARLFRRLGALSGPDFGTRVAAALDDTSPEMVERVLERLVDAQLLETPTENRYRFHDLLKLFARECLNREEPFEARQAAAGRARRWYLEAAVTADTLLGLPSEEHRKVDDVDPNAARAEALRWFQAERANLVATVGEAHRVRDWETAQRLAWSLTDFFALRAHWDDWQHTHELAFEAARRAGDRYGEARSLNGLGAVYDNQGRWEEAIDCHEQSLAICRELGDRLGEAQTLGNLGLALRAVDKPNESAAQLKQALAILEEVKAPEAEQVRGLMAERPRRSWLQRFRRSG